MKEEFAGDPMMQEIHKIREDHYMEGKDLALKERLRRLEANARKFISDYGYKLVPTDHGTHKIVRVT